MRTPRFAVALLVALIGQAVPAKAQELTWDDVRQNNQRAIVYLVTEFVYPSNGFSEEKTGTGFLVHPDGWILTSKHVVPAATGDGPQIKYRASIGGRGETRRKVVVKKRHPDKDLALLLLVPRAAEPWPTVEVDLNWVLDTDQRVYALGFPAANPDDLDGTPGYIRSRLEHTWLTTAPINPGNSGGPVFSMHGRVVGIATAGMPSAAQMNVVLPIRYAKVWLDEIGVTYPPVLILHENKTYRHNQYPHIYDRDEFGVRPTGRLRIECTVTAFRGGDAPKTSKIVVNDGSDPVPFLICERLRTKKLIVQNASKVESIILLNSGMGTDSTTTEYWIWLLPP